MITQARSLLTPTNLNTINSMFHSFSGHACYHLYCVEWGPATDRWPTGLGFLHTTRLKNLFYSKLILNLMSPKVEHVTAVEELNSIYDCLRKLFQMYTVRDANMHLRKEFQITPPFPTSVLNVISNRKEIHWQLPVLCDHCLLTACCSNYFQTVHCTTSTNSRNSDKTGSFREYFHTIPLHFSSTWGAQSLVTSCRLRSSNVTMIKKIRK